MLSSHTESTTNFNTNQSTLLKTAFQKKRRKPIVSYVAMTLLINIRSCVWKQGSWCRMYSLMCLSLTFLKFIIQSLTALMESPLSEP